MQTHNSTTSTTRKKMDTTTIISEKTSRVPRKINSDASFTSMQEREMQSHHLHRCEIEAKNLNILRNNWLNSRSYTSSISRYNRITDRQPPRSFSRNVVTNFFTGVGGVEAVGDCASAFGECGGEGAGSGGPCGESVGGRKGDAKRWGNETKTKERIH